MIHTFKGCSVNIIMEEIQDNDLNILNPVKQLLKNSISNFSVDNESGYEDGVSDVNDTLNDSVENVEVDASDITDVPKNLSQDKYHQEKLVLQSLVKHTSTLTIDSYNTRPPSTLSFTSSTSSLPRRARSKIPIRTKSLNTLPVQPAVNQMKIRNSQSKERTKKKRKVPDKHVAKPLDIWEIQQTLKRGEFVEGVITVGGGFNGVICTPVTIDRGRLEWRY